MIRALIAIGACAILGACATGGGVTSAGVAAAAPLNTPHAILERAEGVAEGAYQACVSVPSCNKDAAWADLMKVRKAYNAGQDITAAVSQVQTDAAIAGVH